MKGVLKAEQVGKAFTSCCDFCLRFRWTLVCRHLINHYPNKLNEIEYSELDISRVKPEKTLQKRKKKHKKVETSSKFFENGNQIRIRTSQIFFAFICFSFVLVDF